MKLLSFSVTVVIFKTNVLTYKSSSQAMDIKGSTSSFQLYHVSLLFQVRQAIAEGNCCFGTVDAWLLFKLTKGGFELM